MKHYSHQARQNMRDSFDVEFGEEFGMYEPLDQEAKSAFLAAKAGGMVTRRLVESGEEMLVKDSTLKNKK